jgi:hypothetical protein
MLWNQKKRKRFLGHMTSTWRQHLSVKRNQVHRLDKKSCCRKLVPQKYTFRTHQILLLGTFPKQADWPSPRKASSPAVFENLKNHSGNKLKLYPPAAT